MLLHQIISDAAHPNIGVLPARAPLMLAAGAAIDPPAEVNAAVVMHQVVGLTAVVLTIIIIKAAVQTEALTMSLSGKIITTPNIEGMIRKDQGVPDVYQKDM